MRFFAMCGGSEAPFLQPRLMISLRKTKGKLISSFSFLISEQVCLRLSCALCFLYCNEAASINIILYFFLSTARQNTSSIKILGKRHTHTHTQKSRPPNARNDTSTFRLIHKSKGNSIIYKNCDTIISTPNIFIPSCLT